MMGAISIETNDKEVIIRLDKSALGMEALVKILRRIQVEYLAQKAGFADGLPDIAKELDQNWWEANGEEFLKNVSR